MRIFKVFGTIAIATGVALASCGPTTNATSTPSASQAETPTAVAAKPANVGDCMDTTVTSVGPRLEGAPDSGSSIQFANGITQTSYDVVPAIRHSRAGDAVHVCLVSIPENCPPNDDRGRVYSAVNARTHETWSAPDSEHMCGGG